MTKAPERIPPCCVLTDVYHHPFLEEGETPGNGTEEILRDQLIATATRACLECPLFDNCLERSIVDHDVAGFAAATTQAQRDAIRRVLEVKPDCEDLDCWTGVRGGPVRTDQVIRARQRHPDLPLGAIAEQLGCSLSTVKRHLRRGHASPEAHQPSTTRPQSTQILTAFTSVTGLRVVSAAA